MKKNTVRAISVRFLLVSLLFLAALFLFGFIADEIVLEKEDLFDSRVFHFFAQFATPGLTSVAHVITFFGSTKFFFPAYTLLIIYFLIKKKRSYAVDLASVGISSTLLMMVLKNTFQRERPSHPIFTALTNYSFPSGHALSSFIFCSVLIYIVWNGRLKTAWKWVLSLLLLLFALCYRHQPHYPALSLCQRCAGGYVPGVCLGAVFVMASENVRRSHRNTEPQQQAVES